jgi:predicted ATP-dependent protease
LFKVAADLSDRVDRSADNIHLYAGLVATLVRRHELPPFDRSAVARVVEHGARMAGGDRLSVRVRGLGDLLVEAAWLAGEAGRAVVTGVDVAAAEAAQLRRLDRSYEEAREEIRRGVVLVDTQGGSVGQVNGLSLYGFGDYWYGHPARITATVRVGEGKVLDIEREVELGGAIHSKGVLILSGFIAARYAIELPLSLAASLVVEQSYGGIDGDSATVAEACSLLSAIAEVPARQDLAVTGSMNQLGQVQAVGGINEKIESFFDVCRDRGLNGTQGVIVPADNVRHLMLRDDVVEAARDGRFHVYPVRTVDEAAALLMSLEAGTRDVQGRYAEGSLNALVEARLKAFAEYRHEFEKEAVEVGEDSSADGR